ncbi:MAG: ribosome recycling factor, partial [Burkholderiales bacterium]|nr:ribosome recycling factor [Burkholderiales bacterium]
TATAAEIKQAFRKLASQHHPDKGGDTQKFQEIQAAYAVLGDEQKRAEADVQKVTDRHVAEIDQLVAGKEHEIMAV